MKTPYNGAVFQVGTDHFHYDTRYINNQILSLPIILNLIFFVCAAPASSLTGIQFGDNGSQNHVTKENGVAMATTQVF